jgi:four helix bundle protein
MDLAEGVYRATAAFPPTQRFRLVDQMQRSAVSVASNIAEGCGRRTRGELLQHLGIALGSLHELETQHELALRLGYIERPGLAEDISLTAGRLTSFTKAVERTSSHRLGANGER